MAGARDWAIVVDAKRHGKVSSVKDLKDLKIALDLARVSGQLLPGATLVMGMQEALSSAGYGDEDISALIRFFRSSPQAT